MEVLLSDYRHGVESKPWFAYLPSKGNSKAHLPKCGRVNPANGQRIGVSIRAEKPLVFCAFSLLSAEGVSRSPKRTDSWISLTLVKERSGCFLPDQTLLH